VARITQMRYFLYARQLFLRANFSENAVTPTLVKPRTGPAHTAQKTPKGGVQSRALRGRWSASGREGPKALDRGEGHCRKTTPCSIAPGQGPAGAYGGG
jgi:hypothetical protein